MCSFWHKVVKRPVWRSWLQPFPNPLMTVVFWGPFGKGLACAFMWREKSSRDLRCWSCAVASTQPCEEPCESCAVSRAPSHRENRGAAVLSLAVLSLSPSLGTNRLRASKRVLRGCWKPKEHLHSGSEMGSSALVGRSSCSEREWFGAVMYIEKIEKLLMK